MQKKKSILKTISDIRSILTGHEVGEKRVLLSQKEYLSPITQIAETHLKEGLVVEAHTHATMDEHFIFFQGKCEIILDEESLLCEAGQYLLVPAGISHYIKVLADTELISIGVATK